MGEYVIRKTVFFFFLWIASTAGRQWTVSQSLSSLDSLAIVSVSPHHVYSLNPHLQVLIDSSGSLDFSEAQDRHSWMTYGPVSNKIPSEAVLWGSIRLYSQAKDSTHWALELGYIDFVEVRINDDTLSFKGGVREQVHNRDVVIGRKACIRLVIPPQQVSTLWIRLEEQGEHPPQPRIQLLEWQKWRNQTVLFEWRELAFLSLFIGIMAIMFGYNLIIFLSIRENTYLFYALYLLSIILTVYFENPVRGFHILGMDNPELNILISFLGFSSTSVFYLLFGRNFINTAELTPRWDSWILRLIGLRFICLLFFAGYGLLTSNWQPGFLAMNVLIAVEATFLLMYFVILIQSKSVLARYFMWGSGFVFLFGFVLVLVRKFIPIPNAFLLFFGSVVIEILIFSLGLGYRMRKEQEERLEAQQFLNQELTKTNKAFGRFVPHEFIRSLGHASVLDVALGDQVEKEVTIFFSDIRSYTSLSEQMNPKENFDFLNSFLGRMGPIIKDRGGFVNQYLGDGIMAIFMDIPDDALHAGIEMQLALQAYNQERIKKRRLPIQIGIGLHNGPLMMGVIGDARRMDAGVVADSVNTGSRMEGLTKHFGVSILISEDVYQHLLSQESFQIRYLGKVLVKGKRIPLKVYECFDGDPQEIQLLKKKTLEAFTTGVEAYLNQELILAQERFQQVLQEFPNDPVSGNYLLNINQLLNRGIPTGWTGVEIMNAK
ncbi:MAG: adenylate/guanylate cyclase domain-containing protein [Bacteroidota bacterium]